MNGTRIKLDNIHLAPFVFGQATQSSTLTAITRPYPNKMSLLHPNFWTYWIHGVFQIIAAVMALLAPRSLLAILLLAVLCWPISAIFGEAIWAMQPGAADWWLMCAKSMIVNIAPTVPMMYCLITRPSQQCLKYSAIWTYCVLGANVVWTLGFLPMAFNAVSCVNGMTGASLTISLIIHECALMSKGVVLFEVSGDPKRKTWEPFDVIYGYGTSLSWLVVYTVWNALFVMELAVGLILQDIAFWAMMIFFYYYSGEGSGIENYFAMARPISLSMYIATSDWPGLHDFFRKAEPMGLDVTSHAFFLFLAVGNFLFSFYVLYWELCLCCGCGGASDYFRKTFKNQSLDLDDEEDDEEYELDDEATTGFFDSS